MTDRLHKIRVFNLDEDGDFEAELIFCTEDETCAVWHECHVEGCVAPEDAFDADGFEGELHGLEHRWIDYSWMSRDTPHNCAANWISYGDHAHIINEHGNGIYSFAVDYIGDGFWDAVGLEKEENET